VSWRGWLVFAVVGSGVALAYRHDWAAAAGAAGCVLVSVAAWVRGEFAATRTRFRESAEWGAAVAEAARAARPVGAGICLSQAILGSAAQETEVTEPSGSVQADLFGDAA
jgi:hypothetical protein